MQPDVLANQNRAEAAAGRYRPDIDGLRAIAVLSVVLYHYRVPPFSGGFVGVDIFFVISGFLITSLLRADLESGRYSILRFYERRIRRIFPALFALAIVTTAVALLVLFPSDLRRYGDSLLGMALFASNFTFWGAAGYFDIDAVRKPLLHTWSLAVEEQFYLFFPPLLFLLWRFGRRALIAVVALSAVVSLGLSVWAVRAAPVAAFYLLPFRTWELMAGALLALAPMRAPANRWILEGMTAVGMVLIAMSVFAFSAETPFPGAVALLPCAGTALLICAGGGEMRCVVIRALAWRPVVAIGLISYSLYLWHWPLLVFARYLVFRDLTSVETTVLIALSFALAALSWLYIEQPFRAAHGRFTRKQIFCFAGAGTIVMLAGAGLTSIGGGLPQRFPPRIRAILDVTSREPVQVPPGGIDKCPRRPATGAAALRPCLFGIAEAPPTFLVWGDSHADMLRPALLDLAVRKKRSGWQFALPGCPSLLHVETSEVPNCRRFNDAVLRLANQPSISTVILAGRWARDAEGTLFGEEHGGTVFLSDDLTRGRAIQQNRFVFAGGLERLVGTLSAQHKKVVIVASVPEIGWAVPETIARVVLFHLDRDIRPTREEYHTRQAFVSKVLDRLHTRYGVQIIYPNSILCRQGHCDVQQKGIPLYRDADHLTGRGARLLEPLFNKVL
ncbi:MAG TPA: acyltransferase family protein [Rhizomicrobium sp.]|nr:acyltransferase family protein [Rhizomicrobium sp.]